MKSADPWDYAIVDSGESVTARATLEHPNKGCAVRRLSELLDIPIAEIATIGDMPNDIAMFKSSGISIVMGQAGEEVRSAATYITSSSEEEGFAKVVEDYVPRNELQMC